MLLTTEVGMDEHCVLLVGTIKGGTSPNSVAESAELGVTLRTDDEAVRGRMQRRIKEVAESVAAAFRGTVEVEHQMGAPGLQNDLAMNVLARETMVALFGEEQVRVQPKVAGEDFFLVSERVPVCFLGLGCGHLDEGYSGCVHQPDVIFNEACFWRGTAALTACALAWLEERNR